MVMPVLVNAQIKINEIMYDLPGADSGREWIEVVNEGAEAVDLTGWKFYEAGINHRLSEAAGGLSVPSQGFVIIADNEAKFRADWPSYSGTLLTSSFSLSNTGETLALRDGTGADIDTVAYTNTQGASGDGASLQRLDGIWSAAQPTPGATNANQPLPPLPDDPDASNPDDSGDSQSSDSGSGGNGRDRSLSAHSGTVPLTDIKAKLTFKVSAGRPRLAAAGSLLTFEALAESEAVAVFSWSFGDGAASTGKKVSHIYAFPGEYEVVLNGRAGEAGAVSRTVATVFAPKIGLELIGADLKLHNQSAEEINLEAWQLRQGNQTFVFPADTIVGRARKITIPQSISNLTLLPGVPLQFIRPDGQLVIETPGNSVSLSGNANPPSAATLNRLSEMIRDLQSRVTRLLATAYAAP